MPEQDDQELEPTFGNCHGETLPESERAGNRSPFKIRKYGRETRSDAQIAEDAFWENARRRGSKDAYEQSKRSGA